MPKATITIGTSRLNQCRKPSGWLGRFVLWTMNWHHSKVTDWGMSKISIGPHDDILDVDCGGGRTISKLAEVASDGKVCGIDHSAASVAFASKLNQALIAAGRVEIQEASVSELPFPENTFDLVTAVETHFWWPDPPGGMREISRVLKPGGTLALIAEVYGKANTSTARLSEKYASVSGMKLLSVDEHRELFADAGYLDIQVFTEPPKGWICAIGRKQAPQ